MASNLDLLLRIRADSKDARSEISKLRKTFDADVKSMENLGKNSFLALGNSIGLTTGQMAAMSKALPLIGIGIAAIATAAAGAGVALFALTKSTADFGSKIFDAAQKTGLATETISAIKFAADQSGSSLADFEVGVKVFARTIGEAARGSEEATAKLVRLGVDPQAALKDLQGALAKAITTINKTEEGTQQMNAAMDAFGSRSGPNLIATIKTMDGDLIKFIATAKALGITFSEEDAKAADKFGDTLEVLSAQFKGVGFQIAQQFMPEIQSAMDSVSQYVRDNQETFRQWGRNLSDLVEGAIPSLRAALAGLDSSLSANNVNWKEVGEGMGFWVRQAGYVGQGIIILGQDLAWLGTQLSHAAEGWKYFWDSAGNYSERHPAPQGAPTSYLPTLTTDPTGMSPNPFRPKSPSEVAAGNVGNPRYAATPAPTGGGAGRGRGGGGGGGGRSSRAIETEEDKAAKKAVDDLAKSQQMLTRYMEDQAAKVFEATTTIPKYLLSIVNLGLAMNKLGGAMDGDTKRLAIHNAVTLEAIRLAAEQQKALDDLNGVIVRESDVVDKLVVSAFAYGETLPPLTERALRLNAAHLDLVATLQRVQGLFAEIDWDAMNPAGTPNESGNLLSVGAGMDIEVPPPPNFDPWKEQFRQLKAIGMDAFGALAQGIGSLVQNWVLLGNASGMSMKKLVASVLAGVAAQAATLAIMELAYAIAALTPWGAAIYGPAMFHFKSAAMFAAVAVGAGLAGRAIAGNSFAQQGAGANAGGGSGGSGARAYEAPTTNLIEQERNQQQRRIDVFLHVESNDSHVLKVLQRDTEGNGWMRQKFALKSEV